MSNWEKTMKEWDDSIPEGVKRMSKTNREQELKIRTLEAEIERLKVRIEELEAAGTILRDCFSLHKPNWLIDKDAIKEWDELTKKECE